MDELRASLLVFGFENLTMDELEIHFFIKNSRHMTSTNIPVAFPPFSMIPCIYGLSLGSICDIFVADLRMCMCMRVRVRVRVTVFGER